MFLNSSLSYCLKHIFSAIKPIYSRIDTRLFSDIEVVIPLLKSLFSEVLLKKSFIIRITIASNSRRVTIDLTHNCFFNYIRIFLFSFNLDIAIIRQIALHITIQIVRGIITRIIEERHLHQIN